MAIQPKSGESLSTQVWHFIVHLRWHYQLFILSGGFLLGGFLSDTMDWPGFLFQFANVHLLLFGGATAYNSYCDKDEGPVGGLKHPPKMTPWMWYASLLLQMAGLILAMPAGYLFAAVYASSILLFWLYSTPLARWKGTPIKSLLAIGISTGTNSLLMGYLAAGSQALDIDIFSAALGVALIILSLFPASQVYQLDEDRRRGDRTFAMKFGFVGVFRFFQTAYLCGLILICISMIQQHFWMGMVFGVIGLLTGWRVSLRLRSLSAEEDDYPEVMRIKFKTSLAFVCFLTAALLIKHSSLGILLYADMLLR